jgi:integrating conjugative element protein (TIGR03757 family)
VLTLLFVLSQVTQAEKWAEMAPTRIEIFSTADRPITAMDTVVQKYPDIVFRIHKLDAIKRTEDKLSQGLPADPEKAERLVLTRLRRLGKTTHGELQHSASSLAKAAQYGVEKYPAIVIDGELVIYGLTDLAAALTHYRHWQLGESS